MHVRKVDTERRRDVRQFIRFPFDLYKGCPQWVPPLLSDARAQLDRGSHFFYEFSDADFFLAEEDGRILGRIAVMDNGRYNAHWGTRTGFFGFFESVNDQRVSRALFQAAFEWARGRDLVDIKGPKELLGVSGGGLLVEGFEYMPAMGIPYNYAYYDKLVTDAGFAKTHDSLSGYFRRGHQVPERILDVAEKIKARRGYWIKTFRTRDEIRGWVPRIGQLHRDAFTEIDDYYPVSDAEINAFAESILSIADPSLIKLVMKDDEIIGFTFAYPNISAGLRKANGHLWPVGWIHLLRERKRTKWVDGNGIGIVPAHQGLGASIVLYAEVAKTLADSRFDLIDVVQVGEDNYRSRSAVEQLGVTWHKRHRNYRRVL